MQTHDFLRELHRILQPRGYLEVGVFRGHSLAMAACPAVGIDPAPRVNVTLPDTARVVWLPSDRFFAQDEQTLREQIPQPLDLALIDGLHTWDQALRDLRNVLPWMMSGGLVVLDDVLPREQAEAGRFPITSAWAGDVWKVAGMLLQADVDILLVDTQPTGLAILSARAELPEFLFAPGGEELPEWVLRREGAEKPETVLAALR